MIKYNVYKVKTSIILHAKLIDEKKIEEYCKLLNKDYFNEVIKIESIQRKKEFITSRMLLNDYFDENVFLSYDKKKPTLNNATHISISHKDQELIVCLNTDAPVGIDIEKISDKISKVKPKFCNEKEIIDLKNNETTEKLIMYWTAKEATYKCLDDQIKVYISDITVKLNSNFTGISEISDNKFHLDFLKINEKFILCHAQQKR